MTTHQPRRAEDAPRAGSGQAVSDIWEPISFAVGDRVRVRLSAECRMDWAVPGEDFGHPIVDGHPSNFDGATGVIDEVGSGPPAWASHPYGVLFARRLRCSCGADEAIGGWFAASELEPLL